VESNQARPTGWWNSTQIPPDIEGKLREYVEYYLSAGLIMNEAVRRAKIQYEMDKLRGLRGRPAVDERFERLRKMMWAQPLQTTQPGPGPGTGPGTGPANNMTDQWLLGTYMGS